MLWHNNKYKTSFFQDSMKYAHLADLHLGSWRHPKMRDLSIKAFLTTINQCVEHQVDFILFAGDLFNTSLPSLDTLKIVTKKLKEIKDQNIPLYVIAGSHDFSPTGKTMIDVLENAGLLINVCKGSVNEQTKELHLNFTTDHKTGAKITGILGRKGSLDQACYEKLYRENLEQESGYKIFMFHTPISELLPPSLTMIDAIPLSYLPKDCNYYAGGHIHDPAKVKEDNYPCVTYPGALFPNNFQEMEKLGQGGYYLISATEDNQEVTWRPLKVIKHQSLIMDCKNKTPEEIQLKIREHFHDQDLNDTIITIRLQGTLDKGKTTDLDFKTIFEQLYKQGAYFIMKNTAKLNSVEFEEIKIAVSQPELIEEEIIKEHLQQSSTLDKKTEYHTIRNLLQVLHTNKKEGETTPDFEQRVKEDTKKTLNLDE